MTQLQTCISSFYLHQYLTGTKHKSHKALLNSDHIMHRKRQTLFAENDHYFRRRIILLFDVTFLFDSFVIYFYFFKVGSGIKVERPLFLDIALSLNIILEYVNLGSAALFLGKCIQCKQNTTDPRTVVAATQYFREINFCLNFTKFQQ